mmetsp:Transcript_97174/g.270403  ORF Transcript_97174/g.270403 Transcript_97174/m.270403 type:complete len:81 (-) Transcript_97174:115-357(-)
MTPNKSVQLLMTEWHQAANAACAAQDARDRCSGSALALVRLPADKCCCYAPLVFRWQVAAQLSVSEEGAGCLEGRPRHRP